MFKYITHWSNGQIRPVEAQSAAEIFACENLMRSIHDFGPGVELATVMVTGEAVSIHECDKCEAPKGTACFSWCPDELASEDFSEE